MSDAADAAARKRTAASSSNKAPSASSLTKAWNEAGKPALVNGTPYVKHNGVLYRKEGGRWVAAPRSGNPATWGPVEREKFSNTRSVSAAAVKKLEEEQKLREFNKLSAEEQAKLKAAADSGKRGRGRPSKKLTLQDVATGKTSVQKTNEELDAIAAEKKARAKAKALNAVSGKEYAGISMVDPKTGKAYTFDAKGNRHESGTPGYRKAMAAGKRSGRGQAQKPAAERAVPTRRSPAASSAVRRAQEGLVTEAMKKGQVASQSKPKAEKAPKTNSKAPKAPAKGNTPANGSKPSTTPSRPRNRAPKVDKPVSPRLEMKSELSKIKRNIETSIRQGERKAAVKAAKAEKAPKVNKPSSLQRSVAAIDKAKAKIDADVKSGKISKRQGATAKRNLSTRTRQVVKRDATVNANRAAKAEVETPKVTPPKSSAKKTAARPAVKPRTAAKKTTSTEVKKAAVKRAASNRKPLTPAQKAADTRAANKASRANAKRLPGNTFEEKLKNFKGAEPVKGSNNLVKIGGKVFRFAGKVLEPVAIASMIAEKAQDPLGNKAYARAQQWKKTHPKASFGDALVASVKDTFGIEDSPRAKKVSPRVGRPAPRNLNASDARAAAMSKQYASKKPSGKGANRSTTPMTGKVVRVQRGGTMWDIAQKNNTTVSALYKANPELAKRKAAGRTVLYSNTAVRVPRKK